MHPDIATMTDVCAMLRISPTKALRLAQDGALTGTLVGARWRLWRPAVAAILTLPGYEEHEDTTPEYVTLDRLCALLGITGTTARRLLASGALPGTKTARGWRIPWAPIRDAIKHGHPIPTGDSAV